MKKIFSFALFLTMSIGGYAQVVDNFDVGPYEVDYKGEGDYQFRLRKGIDLYEYFHLKRDTIVQTNNPSLSTKQTSKPFKSGFLLNASLSLPRYVANGTSNVFGVDGSWKHRIGKQAYFNAGLSLAISLGKYGEGWKNYKDWKDGEFTETLFEIGVPLSIEVSQLDYKTSSLYGGIGVVPTFYTGGKDAEGESKSGLFVAPRFDLGGYLPVGKQIVRIGAFAQYNINCSSGDHDIFKERIGRLFLGATLGIVL